jgi:hypothetical protein
VVKSIACCRPNLTPLPPLPRSHRLHSPGWGIAPSASADTPISFARHVAGWGARRSRSDYRPSGWGNSFGPSAVQGRKSCSTTLRSWDNPFPPEAPPRFRTKTNLDDIGTICSSLHDLIAQLRRYVSVVVIVDGLGFFARPWSGESRPEVI